jgi:predicted 3-demethylubiquinone-9 3-methyltransferase (glyoxalase superfamily)
MNRITPFLWFDGQAEEAALFYTSIFQNSRIVNLTRYGEAGPGRPGSVLTVDFELDGQPMVALNGGPEFHFTEAVSLSIACADQAEVDHFWTALSQGGEEGQCGWLKDRYGLSWQVVPTVLGALMGTPDPEKAKRVTEALMKMKKIVIRDLEDALKS